MKKSKCLCTHILDFFHIKLPLDVERKNRKIALENICRTISRQIKEKNERDLECSRIEYKKIDDIPMKEWVELIRIQGGDLFLSHSLYSSDILEWSHRKITQQLRKASEKDYACWFLGYINKGGSAETYPLEQGSEFNSTNYYVAERDFYIVSLYDRDFRDLNIIIKEGVKCLNPQDIRDHTFYYMDEYRYDGPTGPLVYVKMIPGL